MTLDERLTLSLKFPGEDYSKEAWNGSTDSSLVLEYAKKVAAANPEVFSEDLSALSSSTILARLRIQNTETAHILFGDTSVRVARYDENGDVIDTTEYKGAYHILSDGSKTNDGSNSSIVIVTV